MVQPAVQILKIATIALLSILLIIAGSKLFEKSIDANRPDNIGQSYTITIDENQTIDDVAAELEQADLIQSKTYFKARLRVSNEAILPGTYRLEIGMPVSEIVSAVTGTTTTARTTDSQDITITVIEGWRTEQIAEELETLGLNGGADAFMDAVRSFPTESYDFLADRPDAESLEGYLFPDTYTFQADTPPDDIVLMMLENFNNKVTQELRDRAVELGMPLNEVLIFASLVEREAQVGEERPIIAGIYTKRFAEGWRLEADPTVQYVVGDWGDWWPELSGEDLYIDSPFNTYQVDGLPSGPIANPGYASIRSVLYETLTPYYYFFARADGSGTHLFAATSDEQAQNIAYVAGEASEPAPGSDPFADGIVTE